MSSTSETGHVKNAENFGLVITKVTAIGADYNPSNNSIKLTALSTKKTAVTAVMKAVTVKTEPYKTAVNNREAAYETMAELTYNMFYALEGSGAGAAIIRDAKGYKNKILGRRTGKIPKPTPPAVPGDPAIEPVTISVSQMSFDKRKANFELFVALLAGEPKYTPNENELKITNVNTFIASMETMNDAVDTTSTDLRDAEKARNIELYTPETGVFDLQKLVKKYVRSVKKISRKTYKELIAIKFRNHYGEI